MGRARSVPSVVSTLIVLAAGLALADSSRQRIYQLSIGDPARRDRDVSVTLDTIIDTAKAETLTPEQLPSRLQGVRLLLLGETHTSAEYHRVQLRVIRALHDAGRPVRIGLEMFPYTEQKSLDRWNQGGMTEDAFVDEARWYEHWGYHWRYYRDIFVYARDARIPMYAVNSPREVVAAVRRKGFANLTPDEAKHVPAKVDVDSAEHLAFFKASFEEGDALHGGMSDEAWKSMLSAQATWDATMAYNAVQALRASGNPDAIMVVLVGAGHVAYGVGIERQASQWFDGGIASIVPVPVPDADRQPAASVRASYANFIWGIAAEPDTLFPTLGVSTRAAEGGGGLREVIQVEKDSAAAKAGFQVRDVLISMDGQPLKDRETMNRLLATKTWGDAATFVVRRGSQDATLTAYFRRTPPAK